MTTRPDEAERLAQRRRVADGFVELATEPAGVAWSAADAGGVPGLWAVAEESREGCVVLYLHGGGYVTGSSVSHRRLGGHLARLTGCRVLLLDYGRAPERPHPGPVQDSVTAYRWLLAQGVAPADLVVAGDSSGGGLALATLLRARDEGLPLPAGAVAMSAWTDLEVTGDSVTGNAAADSVVRAESLHALARTFLAGGDPRDPHASPLHGDYAGLCPLYLQVGGSELLLDDTRRVAERASASGVEVTLDVVPDMQHVFQMRAGHSADADRALARIGGWVHHRISEER